ncbi:UNVERIFIED_CONTAM: hypothetical protein FKN15_062322, partial [Acipenser sinensis]
RSTHIFYIFNMDLLNCISERSPGDSAAQSPAEILTPEGNETILTCQYNTTDSSPDLYWYKQNPGESPEYIQHTSQYLSDPSNEFPARFSVELNPSSRTVPLRIQQCELTDSATVTGLPPPGVPRLERTFPNSRTQ